ncbi:MAG: ATP-dependent DNA helicase UvrD2 [Propionibacteriaceae bacterium]|nr:ATP-dependent DNA helicase UvrD2 [Propionibacteriaceae bacterium]
MEPESLLEGLDDAQRLVATSFGRPVAVIAGAGTGKTRALTHRIAYGVATGAYQPSAVLSVTFTTRAAAELRERLAALGMFRVAARTFHSTALRLCRYFWPKAYGAELPAVAGDRRGLLAQAAADCGLDTDQGLLRALDTEVSWTKASNVTLGRYAELADKYRRQPGGLDVALVGKVLGRYEYLKNDRGLIDFDDILLCCCALLQDSPGVAEQVRAQYRHFLVDEYQDVSGVQHTLLGLLLGGSQDLCVVGDPAQTIHTFAGADPVYLTGFQGAHHNARVIRLETDYRSTPEIVGLANCVFATARLEGVKLRPARDSGPGCELVPAASEDTEAAGVAQWLALLHSEGVPWREQAVLYRIHAQSDTVARALKAAGIPYVLRAVEPDSPDEEQAWHSEPDAVTLATLHSAKGLEWDAVAIVGAQDGLLPFSRANTPAQLAEEARLCYVGVTRARTWLRISWTGAVSPFLPAPQQSLGAAPARPRRRPYRPATALNQPCRVCGRRLSSAAELVLGRHKDCPASYDPEIYARLLVWRRRQAEAEGLAEFAIFTDAMLMAIAEAVPADAAGLAAAGVIPAKCAAYGAEILRITTGSR